MLPQLPGRTGARLVSAALLALFSTSAFAPAVEALGLDLQSMLSTQDNLTTFRGLVKDYPEVFSNFPKNGVTILAPNEFAFNKVGNWHEWHRDKKEATLMYHILTEIVHTITFARGDTLFAPTSLSQPTFSNVTGGQHVMFTKQPGGEVVFTSGFATRGTVIVENLAFDGGLIQVIDSVMRVPKPLESTARDAYTELTAFLGALHATGVVDDIIDAKDMTIFAPYNAAFQELAGAFETMNQDDIRRILRYHLYPGAVLHSWELNNGRVLSSTEGNMTITKFNNFRFANSAQFLQTDILLSNGIVQMIDNVLSPSHASARPDLNDTSQRQKPVLTPLDATATGTSAPTPFTSHLPCTAGCPATAPSATETGSPFGTEKQSLALAKDVELMRVAMGVGLAFGALVI